MTEEVTIKQLSKMLESKATLERYKVLLQMEREVTLKKQFERFMNTIGIKDAPTIDSYYPRFRDTVSVVENEDMSIKDRMISIVESDFLFDLMRLKTASRERELRRITKELAHFMQTSSAHSGMNAAPRCFTARSR